MRYNADDTANKHFSSGANELKDKASRNQVIVAPLPDPITKILKRLFHFIPRKFEIFPPTNAY